MLISAKKGPVFGIVAPPMILDRRTSERTIKPVDKEKPVLLDIHLELPFDLFNQRAKERREALMSFSGEVLNKRV